MKVLQGIVFDVDGTLADTEETHRQAFNRTFAEFGLDWDWTPRLYADLLKISGGFERMRFFGADLRQRFNDEAAFLRELREIHRVKTAIYAQMLLQGEVALRPGVRRLIDEARANGIRMAIATSTARSNVVTLLNANLPADWPRWFDSIVTADEVSEKKPSPAVYQAALVAAGLDPAKCVALEDTPNGLRAAHGAGLLTVVTTHYFTRNEHFPHAGLVVDGLGEPDRHFKVREGDDFDEGYVSLKLLDELLAKRDEHAAVATLIQAKAS
ncbi:MAG: HAD-IA family hydrolase [Gammaproteobacteria bacterium]|nr:HAD-IA family hydrolase [Gammaproteobacteria bacterium]